MDCVLLDCKKAFDTVPNRRLVKRLESQGSTRGNSFDGLKIMLVEGIKGLLSEVPFQMGFG